MELESRTRFIASTLFSSSPTTYSDFIFKTKTTVHKRRWSQRRHSSKKRKICIRQMKKTKKAKPGALFRQLRYLVMDPTTIPFRGLEVTGKLKESCTNIFLCSVTIRSKETVSSFRFLGVNFRQSMDMLTGVTPPMRTIFVSSFHRRRQSSVSGSFTSSTSKQQLLIDKDKDEIQNNFVTSIKSFLASHLNLSVPEDLSFPQETRSCTFSQSVLNGNNYIYECFSLAFWFSSCQCLEMFCM